MNEALAEITRIVQESESFRFGPPIQSEHKEAAGAACVQLCGGDQDRGRTLWKLIVESCGGYMPQAAVTALIRASDTSNIVPDVTPPEPT